MFLNYWTLFIALTLSIVAAYYSIVGLTTIFAAAVIPIIIMGSILEIAKVTVTVWLHRYWSQCKLLMKWYLVPAVILLMVITSMGIFGFLSKAHMDQGVPSSDISAKVAILDEKIQVQRENIDAARKALSQMDASVDQTLARSTTEKGASKASDIRKSQNKERSVLRDEIENAQKQIVALTDEKAPIAAQFRKAEAEVGPIKYVASLIYGDNPDANLLERAVRWVIIMLVVVFDPLAIMMVLASTESLKWESENKIVPSEESVNTEDPSVTEEPVLEEVVLDSPVGEYTPTTNVTLVDVKHPMMIWRSLHPTSSVQEQCDLLAKGEIDTLPWDHPDFIANVESGKFNWVKHVDVTST
jgi:outer membrane murein-binding lipoprotein Lpp